VIRGQRVEYIPRLRFPSALLRASIFRRIGRVMQGILDELAVLVPHRARDSLRGNNRWCELQYCEVRVW